jgi:hypothetical protein
MSMQGNAVVELLRPAPMPTDLASCDARVLLNPSFPHSFEAQFNDERDGERSDD